MFDASDLVAAGRGLIGNNVLHDRAGFEDHDEPNQRRLLYPARFLDRIGFVTLIGFPHGGYGVMETCDDPRVKGAQTRPLHAPIQLT